jgi:hypothetical protein
LETLLEAVGAGFLTGVVPVAGLEEVRAGFFAGVLAGFFTGCGADLTGVVLDGAGLAGLGLSFFGGALVGAVFVGPSLSIMLIFSILASHASFSVTLEKQHRKQ